MAPSKNTAREAREARERLRRYNARQGVHANQVKRRQRDNVLAVVGLLVVAALATMGQIFYFTAGPGTPPPMATPTTTPTPPPAPEGQNTGDVPPPALAEGRTWTGTLTLNDNVSLDIELNGEAAPQTVAAFVQGVNQNYFEGKACHRLVAGATAGLLQCGSTDGLGASDPDFAFGPIENAPADGVYPAGTIAMARLTGDAYSQGRQFFIVYEDTQLPADAAGGYTVFGTVTAGLDELRSEIAAAGVDASAPSPEDGPPAVPTTITSITIE